MISYAFMFTKQSPAAHDFKHNLNGERERVSRVVSFALHDTVDDCNAACRPERQDRWHLCEVEVLGEPEQVPGRDRPTVPVRVLRVVQ